jgi:hypothetical protein
MQQVGGSSSVPEDIVVGKGRKEGKREEGW